jgi:alpha-tubulin suppressor-like RCC1 family protein
VVCWGSSGDHKLGQRVHVRAAPFELPGLEDAAQIATGATHLCAVRRSGAVVCTGSNFLGQIGDGTEGGDRPSPVTVIGLDRAAFVTAAGVHTCAEHATGLMCWGVNETGQLGDGTNQARNRPVSVIGMAR